MCVIIDANILSDVFGENRSEAGEKLFEWIDNPKKRGHLLLGGTKLRAESMHVSAFSVWWRNATRSGVATEIKAKEIDDLEQYLIAEDSCSSDDEHIIALAKVSGARLLYSNDVALVDDFRNKGKTPNLLPQPRGKSYPSSKPPKNQEFTRDHQKLFENKKLCKMPRNVPVE